MQAPPPQKKKIEQFADEPAKPPGTGFKRGTATGLKALPSGYEARNDEETTGGAKRE